MNTNASSFSLDTQVVEALAGVLGESPVGLHEPIFSGNEWVYVKECIDSTFVSSVGKFVDRFESELAKYTGAKHAVAVVNGTAALHIALQLAGVKPGDEVLIPALSFVATANAVSYCGASPHFVDSEMHTLGVCPNSLRDYLEAITEFRGKQCVNRVTGKVIRALVPMHTFGHPVDIESLLAVCHDFNLNLVEDAAESLGSTFGGRHTGTFGLMGVVSFNGNKTITTGGGGVILTDNPDLAKHAKHLTTTAKLPHRWEYLHDEVGYNYRMPNINAALGCAQIEQVSWFIANKRNLFKRYKNAFSQISAITVMEEPTGCESNYWLQSILLAEEHSKWRDMILEATNDAGYMTRPVWALLHKLKPYMACQRMELNVAESLERRLINLPSNLKLTDGVSV